MNKLNKLLNYLLSEAVDETRIETSPEMEDAVEYLRHFRASNWSYADEDDKRFIENLGNAETVDDFKRAIMGNETLSQEFSGNLQAIAELLFTAKVANEDPLRLDEGVEEEKGYSGPKKYKKVVGSGKNKRTVRYGAKGYSIAPGTSKGNSYCARSYGQMKDHPSAAKDPNSPLRLSRKRWRCSGKYSKK